MQRDDVVSIAGQHDCRLVRFLYCDNNGLIRGKATVVQRLDERMVDGIGLPKALMSVNSLDHPQAVTDMGPVGEIRLVPDPDTFCVLPYAHHSAAMNCDMLQLDRSPWAACPRSFLKRMRQRAAEDGVRCEAAFEAEFTLATKADGRYQPYDQTVCYSTIAMQEAGAFVDNLVEALHRQGLPVEEYHPELGHGQHEISIRHCDVLRAADNQVTLRETIRGVARAHGLYASLAPKPFLDGAGNGAHIHFSFWDSTGRNLLYDPAAAGDLSATGRHFVAGVLLHLPGLVALTCPSVNSYRRLVPQSLSGAFAIYGYDNREAALRIPSPFWSDPEGSTNLELKAADASCNPYLALGGLLAAGLDGLARRLDPGPAVDVDPATLGGAARMRVGIKRLPTSLSEALQQLEADAVLTEALGPLLARSYLAVRRSEVALYSAGDIDFELSSHFYRY